MTQENVELIQRQIAALNRGDWEGSIEGIDPAIEWIVAREHPAARTVRGLDELREYRADWDQMLEGLTFEAEKIEDRDDLVVTVGHIRGTGSGSGAETDVPIAFVSRFRDGLVIRVEEYLNPDEALEAAGIKE